MRFVFVILHYLGYEDAAENVQSILNYITYDNYAIVIVDNASSNDSVDDISTKYKNEENNFLWRKICKNIDVLIKNR